MEILINNVNELEKYGLRITSLEHIQGSLSYEDPISIGLKIFGICNIGAFTYAGAGEIRNTSIGRYCSIGGGVIIGRPQHPLDWAVMHPFTFNGTQHFRFSSEYKRLLDGKSIQKWRSVSFHELNVVVENDVWIGDQVSIMNSVNLGNGSVVAFRSVVTKNIDSYYVFGGIPAKKISRRFSELSISDFERITTDLIDSNWWNVAPNFIPISESIKNPELFIKDLIGIERDFHPKKYNVSRRLGSVILKLIE
jgi:acetyltransferase-like isoleucine patch superfamily enzyme